MLSSFPTSDSSCATISLILTKMCITTAGDKNISKLHLSCRTSELQFFTHTANTCTCPLKAYVIKNIREQYVI